VGSMRNTIQSEKKYAELVIEIKASMKAETTKRTLELIVRARQISDTQELTDFENQANYNDKLAAGKKALNEGNRDTARWYFKLAQRYMDTKEIQGLIDQVKPITEPAATE